MENRSKTGQKEEETGNKELKGEETKRKLRVKVGTCWFGLVRPIVSGSPELVPLWGGDFLLTCKYRERRDVIFIFIIIIIMSDSLFIQ